jgi:hypothetical protein
LEKRAEQVLPGSEEDGGVREWVGARGRNDPNNVCTYEYMNNEKKKRNKRKTKKKKREKEEQEQTKSKISRRFYW